MLSKNGPLRLRYERKCTSICHVGRLRREAEVRAHSPVAWPGCGVRLMYVHIDLWRGQVAAWGWGTCTSTCDVARLWREAEWSLIAVFDKQHQDSQLPFILEMFWYCSNEVVTLVWLHQHHQRWPPVDPLTSASCTQTNFCSDRQSFSARTVRKVQVSEKINQNKKRNTVKPVKIHENIIIN